MVRAADARIDQQNAEGGVFGRKIKLIVRDDGTNPSTDNTDTADLISKGVFGVIDDSAVTYGGYKLLQQAGVPVTGGAYDGPEWYQQPNTNMFSISGPGDAKDPQYDNFAVFAKDTAARSVPRWATASHRPRRPPRAASSCPANGRGSRRPSSTRRCRSEPST